MTTKFNYATIKTLAKQAKTSVKNLVALSPNNDPFYTGTPSDNEKAEWFSSWWDKLGYSTGVHLRRMHYAIFSQPDSIKPNGEKYQNTESDWAYLNEASKSARYLGLVDIENFVDRRNPEAIINRHYLNADDWGYIPSNLDYEIYKDDIGFSSLYIPQFPQLSPTPDLPQFIAQEFEVQQPIHLEIWCEKTTMNDELLPLCQKYGINLITGMGELSITATHQFINRLNQANRIGQILYISDYDPSGYNMPSSISRKLEYFYRNNHTHKPIKLDPIMLTKSQIERLNLPTKPVKRRKDGRKMSKSWHGDVVELDALEAIHPGEFSKIVEQNILYFYDADLADRCLDIAREFEDILLNERDDIIDTHAPQIEEIYQKYNNLQSEWQAINAEYNKITAPLSKKLTDLNNKIETIESAFNKLINQIERDMETTYIDIPESPSAILPDYHKKQLFSTNRDYLEQLKIYKSRKLNGKGK